MSLIIICLLSLLVPITYAIPFDLVPRSTPCDLGSRPILYVDYHNDACPPPVSLSADGSCPISSGCQSFCQIRTNYTYTQEVPLGKGGYCHGPLTCAVTDTDTTQWTIKVDVNLARKFGEAFTSGITGGWSYSATTTKTETKSVVLMQGECGYMTFLPIVKSICGSATEGTLYSPPNSGWLPQPALCIPPYTTTGNTCISQPAWTADKSAVLGTTILVRTDCSTNAVLPDSFQDDAYKYDGVRLPQNVVASTLGAPAPDPGPSNPNTDDPTPLTCPAKANTPKCD